MAKTLKKKVHKYSAIFKPEKSGGFSVTIPSLPGCISEGDTFEEALGNIKEAAALYIEVMKKDKRIISDRHSKSIVAPIYVKA